LQKAAPGKFCTANMYWLTLGGLHLWPLFVIFMDLLIFLADCYGQ